MKKIIALIICLLVSLPGFAKKKKSVHHSQHHHYVRKRVNAAHDSLSEPITIADSIIFEATKHLGKPYRSGNKGPYAFDCSGFTSYVYKQLGFFLASNSRDQYMQGVKISTEDVHKGDLIFFTGRNPKGGIGHVGIVYDVNPKSHSFRFIHAASSGISIDRYPDAYYFARRYRGLRRVIDYGDSPLISTPDTFSFRIKPLPIKPTSTQNYGLSVADESNYHKVKNGENLYRIAQKYHCTVSDLRKWNNLTAKQTVKPGQRIIIREIKDAQDYLAEAEEVMTVNREDNQTYTVVEGDNIQRLSEKYACTAKEIMTWNKLKTTNLNVGQVLVIRPKTASTVKDEVNGEEIIHTVAKGENIYSLAKKYKCSIRDVKQWNNISDIYLQQGQKLVFKKKNVESSAMGTASAGSEEAVTTPANDNGNTHTVKKGETLADIANAFGCTTQELMKWNHLDNSKVRYKQIIKTKQSEGQYIAEKTLASENDEDEALPTEGNATTEADIIGVSTQGQVMPLGLGMSANGSDAEDGYYTVKSNDNLRKIAAKYGCTSGDIIRWNRLKNYSIRPGQKLKVKANAKSSSTSSASTNNSVESDNASQAVSSKNGEELQNGIYVVQKGDNIHKIAAKYGCTAKQIAKWNKLKTYTLRKGQKLKIKTAEATANTETASTSSENVNNTISTTSASSTKAEASEDGIYIVKTNDNLRKIAAKNGCTSGDIIRWNKLKNYNIKPGQKLIVKAKAAVSNTNKTNTETKEDNKVETKVNNTNSNDKKTSQSASTVNIDDKQTSSQAAEQKTTEEIVYTVKSGDNLSKIASKYKCKTSDIMKWNNLNNINLSLGQKLKIRSKVKQSGSNTTTSTQQQSATNTAVNNLSNETSVENAGNGEEYGVYTVKKGDYLRKIAAAHGCTAGDLIRWNKLKNYDLHAGQKLKVKPNAKINNTNNTSETQSKPAVNTTKVEDKTKKEPVQQSIKTEETIKKEAAQQTVKVNTSVSKENIQQSAKEETKVSYETKKPIVEAKTKTEETKTTSANTKTKSTNTSNSKNTTVTAGADDIVYTIKSGDNLRAIGKRYGCTSLQIINWNHLTNYALKPGQKLIIKGKGSK